MVRYDENGRPIKDSNSFFGKTSKHEKRKYSKEINSKRDNYESEIKKVDRKIKENNTSNQAQETVTISQEVDLSNFPVIIIYPLIWFTNIFGLITGFVIYQSLKQKNILGKEKIMKNIKIAMILYLVFFALLFAIPFLLPIILGNGTFSYSSP